LTVAGIPLMRRPPTGATALWGSTFLRPPTLDRWAALQFHRWGIMGRSQRALIETLVQDGMQVADVGATPAIFTLLMSRLVGPSGRVIALEPDPTMAAALRDNLRANAAANVVAIEAGADSHPGEAMLFRSPRNAGDSRLAQGELPASCLREAVKLVRLDDVVPDRRLDFVKIDTQGWEMNVLEGMSECLRANRRLGILFEFWPHGLRQAGRQPEDVLTMLFDLGFEIGTLSGAGLPPGGVPDLVTRLSRRRYTDLIAKRQ